MERTTSSAISPVKQEQTVIRAGTDALCVQVVSEYERFVDLARVWDRLVDEAGIDHPYLRHGWMRAWWDTRGGTRGLYVLVVHAGDQPLAIAPLMTDRAKMYGIPMRRLTGIGGAATERFDLIVKERPEDCCRAIWAHVSARADNWDVLELRQLTAQSHGMTQLAKLAVEDRFLVGSWRSTQSPYVPVKGAWAQYYGRLSKNHQSNMRRRRNGMNRLGRICCDVVTSDTNLERDVADCFRLEAAAWKGANGTAIVCRADTNAFYTRIIKAAAADGHLRLYFLTVDGRRIATTLAMAYRNKLFVMKLGYDPAFARYTPSQVLMEHILQQAWEHQLEEVDLLGETATWKECWTDETRAHQWLFILPSRAAGRAIHRLKFRIIPQLEQSRVYHGIRYVCRKMGFCVHAT